MRTKLHKRSFPSKPESVQAVTTGEVVLLDLFGVTYETWDSKRLHVGANFSAHEVYSNFTDVEKKLAMQFCADTCDVVY